MSFLSSKAFKQVFFTVLGSFFPAIINIVSVTYAVVLLDADRLGQVFMVISLFFVCIDIFNFGTTRLVALDGFLDPKGGRIWLDLLSGLCTGVQFYLLCLLLNFSAVLDYEVSLALALFGAVGYCLGYIALGYLRVQHHNQIVSLILSAAALLRLLVVWLCVEEVLSYQQLVVTSVLIEGLYGLALLLAYALLAKQSLRMFSLNADFFFQRKGTLFCAFMASWRTNAFFMCSKHLDIVLLGVLMSPAVVAYYRPIKSMANLSFNLGSSVSLVIKSQIATLSQRLVEYRFLALASVSLLVALLSLALSGLELGFLAQISNGSSFAYVFLGLLVSAIVFANRIVYFYLFSSGQARQVSSSSLFEVVALFVVMLVLSVFEHELVGPLSMLASAFIGYIVLTNISKLQVA
ncbi:hypothetical protein [Agarivorans aestuarii]|uniref:hypothetical protein n=1 Tax=Agarivorans aestuarii TaxID=1563703 RepID=UPI001C817DC7|nr:hypothetical protein [Agarivorans aestuarii]